MDQGSEEPQHELGAVLFFGGPRHRVSHAVAGHSPRAGLRPQQRQPLEMALVSLGLVWGARIRRLCRAYYLCYSFHGVVSSRSIFGLYFFVPFLWAANILLLELGLVSQQKKVLRLALWVPAGLVALSMTSSPREAADLGFLTLFHDTLQMSPLFLCMATATAFYFVALLRRVPAAWLAIAAVLVVFSVCGPNTYNPAHSPGRSDCQFWGSGFCFSRSA